MKLTFLRGWVIWRQISVDKVEAVNDLDLISPLVVVETEPDWSWFVAEWENEFTMGAQKDAGWWCSLP